MQRAELQRVPLRLIAAWLALSALGLFAGEFLIGLSRPALSLMLTQLAPGLSGPLEFIEHRGQRHLRFNARTTSPRTLGPMAALPAGQPLPSSASLAHVLVPLVIFGSLVVAWPARSGAEAWRRLICGSVGAALVLLLTTPVQLVGLIELAVHDYAQQQGAPRAPPLLVQAMLMLEGGGRWALPVAMATLVIALARAARRSDGWAEPLGRAAQKP